MDLFDYAGELFNRQGKLHVPGLGYFAQGRKASYYDNGNLYPPVNQISFVPNAAEDDEELINYFASQKRISPASAKYFVDKFVDQLKSKAGTGESNFADLGTFYTADGTLHFKAKETNFENDPAVFGLAPVPISKLADVKDITAAHTPRLETEREAEELHSPVTAHTAVPVQSDTPQPAAPGNTSGTDDPMIILNSSAGREQQNGTSPLLWTLYAVIAMAIIGAGLWYYTTRNPGNDKVNAQNNPVNQSFNAQKTQDTTAALKATPDTANSKSALSADSAAALSKQKATSGPVPAVNTNTPPSPELFKNSWVVSGGQNNDYAGANRLMARYRGQGYPQARLLDSVKKKEWFIYRVVFGLYDTKQQAMAARRQLLKDGKLRPKYITVQPTNKE